MKSALLPPLSPDLAEPQPPVSSDDSGGQVQTATTIAAGKLSSVYLYPELYDHSHFSIFVKYCTRSLLFSEYLILLT